jgi:hypothetical protein
MQALREVTNWDRHLNHTYLIEGSKILAYIKHGTIEVHTFAFPLNFNRSGRKFENVNPSPFNIKKSTITIKSSSGSIYEVDTKARTCTCTGFSFRGKCKHLG